MESIGRDKAVVLANHSCDMDWLFGWLIANNYGCLGVRSVGSCCLISPGCEMPAEAGFDVCADSGLELVVFGIHLPCSELVRGVLPLAHISREKDRSHLEKSTRILGDFPMAFWVCSRF